MACLSLTASVAHLVTVEDPSPLNERNREMMEQENQQPDGVCRMWNGQPLSKHGAFMDIEEHQRVLSMGGNALKAIGAMMLPGTDAADEATTTKRSELSEIFSFFGEVMAERSQLISDAVFRIEQAANGRCV
jgi:hypothetical protein